MGQNYAKRVRDDLIRSLFLEVFLILLYAAVSFPVYPQEVSLEVRSFSQCKETALANYLPVQIAREEKRLAELKIDEALRNLFPQAALKYQDSRGVTNDEPFRGERYNLELKQPVSFGGKEIYLLKQARQELAVTENNLKRLNLDLFFEVAQAYCNFIYSKHEYSVYLKLQVEAKKILELAELKFKEKAVSQLEYSNNKYLYEDVLFKLSSSESDFSLAQLELSQKLNAGEKVSFRFSSILSLPQDVFVMDECVNNAFNNRPELKMLESSLLYAQYGRQAVKAEGLPNLELTGRIGQGKEAYKYEELDLENEWFAGAKVTIPLGANTASAGYSQRKDAQSLGEYYSGSEYQMLEYTLGILDNMNYRISRKKSEISYKKALNELQDLKKKITQEIREAYYNYQKTKIELEAVKSKREFFRKDEEVIKVKEQNGEAALEELLEAKIKRAGADAEYWKVMADLNISLVSLQKAQGIEEFKQ